MDWPCLAAVVLASSAYRLADHCTATCRPLKASVPKKATSIFDPPCRLFFSRLQKSIQARSCRRPQPFARSDPKMAPVNILSDDSDSGEDLNQIAINEHYAKAYAYRKERQELERREHSFQTHEATLSLHCTHFL